MFIHLRARSAFSLCEGSIQVKNLAKMARKKRMPAIAMTDKNNMFGALEFSKYCDAEGVQPIIGTILTVYGKQEADDINTLDEVVLLCQNEVGYKNLSKLVSISHLDTPDPGVPMVHLNAFKGSSDGLICLWGGGNSLLANAIELKPASDILEKRLSYYKTVFPQRLYIELQRCGYAREAVAEEHALTMARDYKIPVVATNDVYFPEKEDHQAHDILMCIGQGRYEYEDERDKISTNSYLKTTKEMKELFSDLPAAIQSTVEIAKRCSYRVWYRDPVLPVYPVEDGETEEERLRIEVYKGFEDRFKRVIHRLGAEEASKQRARYIERVEFELNVINGMKFPGYFLIVSDFMKWTKKEGIPIGVRGSGASSIVAWCMYITQLDPLRFDLVFERFLNPERVSLPDFDIDFCQSRRGEVIKYVQEKYGDDCVAQIITFGKLQAKAAVRDVGRVVGLPYPLVNKISKLVGDHSTLKDALSSETELRNICKNDDLARKGLDLAQGVEGLYRHASTHAAGLIIADKPIVEYLPLYKDPNSDMPVTQFHFKDAESVGLVKFDFLGLRTLTIVSKTVEMVKENKGVEISIDGLTFDDDTVYDMLQEGDTTGVFQLESAGMKDLLKRLKPNQVEHLVALISLYRPGPMDSIPSFIARANGDEDVVYDHPMLESVLEETYGVITYQEDVMQIGRDLAGYSLGEADLLRRAMGKKNVAEMDKHRVMFCEGALKHNIDEKTSNAIFDKCAKFSGYGFNKAHAAAYAQVSYQTAYLKHFYPLEFHAACMTVDRESVDRLYTYVKELKQKSVTILPPDINESKSEFFVETNNEKSGIRYSLSALKGVGDGVIDRIVQDRVENGKYTSIEEMFLRCADFKVPSSTWEKICKAGGLDSIHPNRGAILSNIKKLMRIASEVHGRNNSNQADIFSAVEKMPSIIPLNTVEDSNGNNLDNEKSVFGFYFSGHPCQKIEPYINHLETTPLDTFSNLSKLKTGAHWAVAIVEGIQFRRSNRSGKKYAFVHITDASGDLETLVFSDTLEAASDSLTVGNIIIAGLNVENDDGKLRTTLTSAKSIDEEFSRAKSFTVEVSLAHKSDELLDSLSVLYDKIKPGRTDMFLTLEIEPNKIATFEMPSKGTVSIEDLSNFRSILPKSCVNLGYKLRQFSSA